MVAQFSPGVAGMLLRITIGKEEIRFCRKSLDITQTPAAEAENYTGDPAQRCKTTKGFLSQLENMRALPSLTVLLDIAQALNVKPGDLLAEHANSIPYVVTRHGQGEHVCACAGGFYIFDPSNMEDRTPPTLRVSKTSPAKQ